MKRFKPVIDVLVTVVVVCYFFLPFFLVFWPFYFYFRYFSQNKERGFQAINHCHTKVLFMLVKTITPGLAIKVQDREDILAIRSSIIVCNHISFLDPLFLFSVLKRAITISNDFYFHVPVFGWILKNCGYLSAASQSTDEFWSDIMIRQIKETLKDGGNVIIFPEGTRSRTGKLSKFQKGAFYFAKQAGAPIEMLEIKGTNLLYTPGKHILNTCLKNTIELRRLGRYETIEGGNKKRVIDIRNDIFDIYRKAQER